MGNKQSTREVIKYVESDKAKQAMAMVELDKQLSKLSDEVRGVDNLFPSDKISETMQCHQDTLIMRYERLNDMGTILKNIETIYAEYPGIEMLKEHAKRLIQCTQDAASLKEIMRWQSCKALKVVDGKSVGIEIHYKLKIFDESSSGGFWRDAKKETLVLIAYKCVAHAMNVRPTNLPDYDKVKKLTF